MLKKMPGSSQLVVGQIVFMISSYLMHIAITRLLGPEDYGTWGILLALLIWFELSVMIGFPKWTTRQIAEESDESRLQQIKTVSLLGQGIAALILAVAFYLLASVFSGLLNDPELEFLLKISAFDIPLYAFYFVNFGIINGMQGYGRMSLLTALYGISKMGFVIAFILGGFGLPGAAIGNVLSSVVVLLISLFWIGKFSLRLDGQYRLKDFFSFGIPSTIFILGFALLHQVDFLVLKSISLDKKVVGFYMLAMMLAKVPYFIVEATSKSLFSEMSYQSGLGRQFEVSTILSDYVYMTVLIFGLIIAVTMINTKELILLIFPDLYIESVPYLRLLIISNSLVGITYLLSQTLFVFDREKLSFVLVFGLLCLAFPLNYLLIQKLGPVGAAVSSLITFSTSTLLFFFVNRFIIQIRLPVGLLLRMIPAAIFTVIVSMSMEPGTPIGYFLKLALSTLVYMMTLLLLKEPVLLKLYDKAVQSVSLKR